MKKVIILIVVLISNLILSQVKEERKLANFNQIDAQKGVRLFITQSDIYKVEVEADNEEKLAQIITKISDNVLKINVDAHNVNFNRNDKKCSEKENCFKIINIYISVPHIEKITASSGVSIALENTFQEKNFALDISSGVSFEGELNISNSTEINASSGAAIGLKLNSKDTKVNVSSGVVCGIEGSTKHLEVDASSGAVCSLEKLESENCYANATTASAIQVNCSQKLQANAYNLAQVTYIGNPELEENYGSSGSVKQKNK